MAKESKTVLDRTLLIIDSCLAGTQPSTLAMLTAATGLPKPTVHRIAEALVRRRLLERIDGRYLAGEGLIRFGEQAAEQRRSQSRLQSRLVPHLVELQHRTAGAVFVINITADDRWPILGSVYDRPIAASGYAESWPHSPADPAIIATACGRLALASRPHLAEQLLRREYRPLTVYSRNAPSQLVSQLRRDTAENELVEHDAVVLGWSCLAVSVPVADGLPSAVLGVVNRTPRFRTAAFLRWAHAAATDIAAQ